MSVKLQQHCHEAASIQYLMLTILNQATHSSFGRRGRRSLVTGITILSMSLGMAAAFGTAQNTVVFDGQINEVIEQISAPSTDRIGSAADSYTREVRIRRGDTLSSLLSGMGIQDEQAATFLRSDRNAEALSRQLAPGKTITAQVASAGNLHSLTFPLNGGKDTALIVQRTSEGFAADVQQLQLETKLSLQSATIQHSLFGAADDAGIPDSVATQLADIFGGDIDFHRDIRKGDRFSVIYETASHLGKPVRTQRILAAEFINDGKVFRAFWYQHKDGTGGYYTEEGRNVRKAFLRSPLEFSRITSGFSNARYHPVLRETRAHRGIDYGASTGTRVRTTGDGTVEFAGTQGGYGKVVMVRHSGNRTTVYGHLSEFASGIKNGMRVAQGDVIGFVGATGIATGPHLHYEFRVAGMHRNPLTVALPEAAPISPVQLATFKSHTNNLLSQIASVSSMQLVMLD
ncbi:MAG: peptidoglycan DD-metalloendopeptidase family protein [Sulfuritalea sp.]|nr:peptidoglycan DD-metalloendopeptidase family protein [Sulfuritalea sp.]